MNCREFLIEFEDRGTLTEPAILHLTVCADCKKTSERQTQIWQIIDKFARVNAPSDFDFRVKARIAGAEATDFQPRFLPVLRYVLPVAVIVALVGLIAFNFSYFSSGKTGEVAATGNKNSAIVEGTKPDFNNSTEQLAFAPSPAKIEESPIEVPQENPQMPTYKNAVNTETAKIFPNRRTKSSKSNDDDEGAGSITSGVGSNKPRAPKGFELDSNSRVETQKSSDENMLSFNDIESAVENGKRTVKSVKPNGVGARSGIKVGDVIEKVVGDSIFVSRGAERIEIKLQRTIGQP